MEILELYSIKTYTALEFTTSCQIRVKGQIHCDIVKFSI